MLLSKLEGFRRKMAFSRPSRQSPVPATGTAMVPIAFGTVLVVSVVEERITTGLFHLLRLVVGIGQYRAVQPGVDLEKGALETKVGNRYFIGDAEEPFVVGQQGGILNAHRALKELYIDKVIGDGVLE